jgi:hypothetical protein
MANAELQPTVLLLAPSDLWCTCRVHLSLTTAYLQKLWITAQAA